MQYDKKEIFTAAIHPLIQEVVAACMAAGVPIVIEACYSVDGDEAGRYSAQYMPSEATPIQMAIAATVAAAPPEAARKAYDALTGQDLAKRVEVEVRNQVEFLMSKFN